MSYVLVRGDIALTEEIGLRPWGEGQMIAGRVQCGSLMWLGWNPEGRSGLHLARDLGEDLQKQVLGRSGTLFPEARPVSEGEALAWGCHPQVLCPAI